MSFKTTTIQLSSTILHVLIMTLVYLTVNTAHADDIFTGYIPCETSGDCGNEAGDAPDEEVGQIGLEFPESFDDTLLEGSSDMCTVTQPALSDIFIPSGQEDQNQYDCSKIGCRDGNLVEIPDDSDISLFKR